MKPYDLNLSQDARNTFDALAGGLARGGELFRLSGIQNEDDFLKALRELADKGLVTLEGEVAPRAIMLAVVSARPSAFDYVERSKRVW